MKKKVRLLDFSMLPVLIIAFIIGYAVETWKAGYAVAEWYFDPESFEKRYMKK